ncbi:MAG: radical SAM family heme chaperone HemW [Candidatus Abyssobacteria bacterium SURF_5]|uniref:Heme chaperone HemW n=1 Tax=Abyssobacteria bacterium (strain SURF_5) TaxID=2093360 RepID=A0A3A4N6N8_ABYX5|nr:MAG: radical SAM family heme chaperone HemW [Candidatus Abyssubacteria bacterium SURF_5]
MAEAVYVHIPYCSSKCPYCDFASVPAAGSVDRYLEALGEEIRQRAKHVSTVRTLHIGGGTPTVLSAAQITRLFHSLRSSFHISTGAEITLEANPCTVEREKIDAFISAGGNRVSLGAQSFIDSELTTLGRLHGSEDIYRANEIIRGSGIKNLNFDLIFAIPDQTIQSWRHSLEEAVSLAPEHLSTYCLTVEPGTPFDSLVEAGTFRRKTAEEELELYQAAREILIRAGYEHYEISNFAKPGRRASHNLVYWSNGEYLGLGASAVSYLDGKRVVNVRDPVRYMEAVCRRGHAVEEAEYIPLRMQAIETMIQRLRLSERIDCSSFRTKFGVHPVELFGGSFEQMVTEGYIEYEDDTIRSTFDGWRLANEVAMRLLP